MLKRKITAALMAAALTLAPVKNAYALENYWALGEIMEIIDDAYVGEKPNEDEIFYSALHGIADSLDGYSQFFTEGELQSFLSSMETEGYLFGIAIDEDSKGNVYIKEVLKGSTAEEEGLQEKDQIVKVNGVLVSGYDSYYILEILNQRADGTASVEILRSGVPMKKELKKTDISYPMVEKKNLLAILPPEETKNRPEILKNTGYLGVKVIGEGAAQELADAIKTLKNEGKMNLILDLRGNTGGYFEEGIEICRLLVPEGNIITKVDSKGNKTEVKSTLKNKPFKNIMVLVDENTASAAEIISSALQDSGSLIIGQQTYGKGVGQSVYEIPEVGYFKITTEKYYTRLGRELNMQGVTPNIPVEYPEALYVRDYTASSDIIEIKALLSFCGYKTGTKDGVLDEVTKASIHSFKSKNGLAQDMKLDSITKFAMNQMLYDQIREYDLELVMAARNILQ